MKRLIFSFAVLSFLFIFSCKKSGQLPLVTTLRPYETGLGQAMCGGVIYTEGKDEITAKGVCWSTTENPTINHNFSNEGPGPKNFSGKISGLKQNTTYHIRAYATNKYGTSYGSDEILPTLPAAPAPKILASTTKNITLNSVVSLLTTTVGPGVAPLIKAGVCWSKYGIPTTDSSFATGTVNAQGIISTTAIGLASSTTYTLRAFATNSTGTTYDSAVVIKTFYGTVTDIDQNVYQTVQIGTQIWMAENLKVTKYRDGSAIVFENYDPTTWTQPTASVTGVYGTNNNSNYVNAGLYYNWAAATKNIAPAGWHVPTQGDFQKLITTLGGQYAASEKLRSTDLVYWSDGSSLTNPSGFSAIPGGYKDPYNTFNGSVYRLFLTSCFWTSSFAATNYSSYSLEINEGTTLVPSTRNHCGLYIRLIKD